jgi:hypothetical protein
MAPLVVSAPSVPTVALSLTQAPSQVIAVTESNGTPATFSVVSANTAVGISMQEKQLPQDGGSFKLKEPSQLEKRDPG